MLSEGAIWYCEVWDVDFDYPVAIAVADTYAEIEETRVRLYNEHIANGGRVEYSKSEIIYW
jgi:hypothetical protein